MKMNILAIDKFSEVLGRLQRCASVFYAVAAGASTNVLSEDALLGCCDLLDQITKDFQECLFTAMDAKEGAPNE